MEMRYFSRKSTANQRTWHGAAVIIEAMAILFFLTICIALLMLVLSFSFNRTEEANQVSNAIILATNEAETFSANPTGMIEEQYYEIINGELVSVGSKTNQSYSVTRSVKSKPSESGILYSATIQVSYRDEVVYELDSARYVSDGGVALHG